jgi:ribonucleoside-diphosphate reductase alpha chain
MHIERRFTETGKSPYANIAFRDATSEIRNPDGSVVFRLSAFGVPQAWSQVAADVLAQKYFRKAGVAKCLKKVKEKGIPEFLWRSEPDQKALVKLPKDQRFGSETSAKDVFDRLAGAWAYWGWKGGYFSTEEDAQTYFDEMRYMLAKQMAAPNSPQWFNTGLHWAYGIDGPSHVSSSRSATTSSTRAASWTSGPARHGFSNTARAPAPISPCCAPRTSRSAAAANHPGS